MKRYYFILLTLATTLSFVSCNNDDDSGQSTTQFGIFRVTDTNTVEMNGDITSSTLDDFNSLIQNHPTINKINMNQVPGSADDEINLQVAKRVHELNIATHILDNGEIASGGVDFFVAGITRTKGANTRIGVHSWSDGQNDATAFPVGHANHLPYINYFVSVGFTQQQAEDFYYFTINAAPAADIHWMTEPEIAQYGLLKP